MSKYPIKITPVTNSRLSEVDFNNIPFGTTFSDHMFEMDYINGEWTNMEIKPFGPITMMPTNCMLHYGQSLFEGSKAFKDKDGTPILFRPEMHSRRLNASAERLCMATIPEDLFIEALSKLVAFDSDWIPTVSGASLYLRPFLFATDDFLGVKPSQTYKFMIITGPSGPYYSQPVSLKAEEYYVRAAIGGVGEAKCAGNYAASLLPAQKANAEGFDQILWLDAKEYKYVQEVGTMNIFFVIGDTVITPIADGAILKGITKDSFLTILRDKGYKTEERLISIQEVADAYNSGNLKGAFGCGTATVASPIKSITYKDLTMEISEAGFEVGAMLKSEIEGIRARTIDDKFGWVHPLEASIPA